MIALSGHCIDFIYKIAIELIENMIYSFKKIHRVLDYRNSFNL